MKARSKVGIAIIIFSTVIIGGAIAFVWSVDSYHARHRREHLETLRHIQESHPTEEQLRQMLGEPLTELPSNEALAFARKTWGEQSLSISADTSRRSTHTLIFQVSDMVYLVFLDSSGSMIDFALLRN